MVLKIFANAHSGSQDVTVVGTHTLDGASRVLTGNGVTLTLTTDAVAEYDEKAGTIAAGYFVKIKG